MFLAYVMPAAAQVFKVQLEDTSVVAYPIPTPAGIDSMWAYDQRCSGMPAVPNDLSHIVWLKATFPMQADSGQILGKWTPPDTIVLSTLILDLEGHVADSARIIVTHELLHYLLRGPVGASSHPFWPFAIPCGLMNWQQDSARKPSFLKP